MSPLLSDAFALAERAGGAPVYLYTFARGAVMWRYTSDGLALTVASTGISYVAAKIDHEKIQRNDESGGVEIKVTLASRLAVVAALRDGSTLPMYLAIHKYHPAAGGTPARFAYGTVGSPSLDSATGVCELTLRMTDIAFEIDVPKAIIAVPCHKTTYSAECGADPDAFSLSATVATIGYRTIEVDSVGANPDGYYDSGIIKFGDRELLYIQRQVGTVLTVFSEIPSALIVGTDVTLLAGDDKNPTTCRIKFDNLARFGGFPWLPAKNPLLIRNP